MFFTYLTFVYLLWLSLRLPRKGPHPVPLPTDMGAAKCIECHAEKAQGKYAHAVITAIGYLACHKVETNNATTEINLVSPSAAIAATEPHSNWSVRDPAGWLRYG